MKLPSAAEWLIESREIVQHITLFLHFGWDILCKEVFFFIWSSAKMWIRCWTTPLSVKEGHSLFLLSRTGHRSRSDVSTVSAVVWLVETRPSHRIFSPQTRSHAHAGPQLIGSDCCESALWLMIMCFIDLLLLEAILGSILSLLCILLFSCLLLFFS